MSVNVKVQQAGDALASQYNARQLYALEERLMPIDLDEAYLKLKALSQGAELLRRKHS